MESNVWWIGPLVLVALRLLYAEAQFARAEWKGALLVFRASRSIRGLLAVGILGMGSATVLSIGREAWWIVMGFLGLLLLVSLSWPPTALVGEEAITQKWWWGRSKSIAWENICGLERRAGGEVAIFGQDGTLIVLRLAPEDAMESLLHDLKFGPKLLLKDRSFSTTRGRQHRLSNTLGTAKKSGRRKLTACPFCTRCAE